MLVGRARPVIGEGSFSGATLMVVVEMAGYERTLVG